MRPASVDLSASSAWRGILLSGTLGSGAALVATIVTGKPLWFTLLIFAFYLLLISAFVWVRATCTTRVFISCHLRVGLIAGIAATLAYDLSRLFLVKVVGLHYWPFETLILFGRSILGSSVSRTAAYAAGALYHAINGLLFSVGYTFLFGARKWAFGLVYAMVLEVGMLLAYSHWFDIRSIREEFAMVSFVGHISFGTTLGLVTSQMLRNPNSRYTHGNSWTKS